MPPEKYDFEKIYNVNFGVIKEDVFEVTVEFTGWSAQYVSERVWSPDQKIKKIGKNKIHLTFTAASETEVISWVLFFGEEAKVIAPSWLVKEMKKKTQMIANIY
jgi:predicted DNA-binding transcriptional regulator YafY